MAYILDADLSPAQATLLNILLRNYLEFNLFEQADTLIRKTTFPEGDASNNQVTIWQTASARAHNTCGARYCQCHDHTLISSRSAVGSLSLLCWSCKGSSARVHRCLQESAAGSSQGAPAERPWLQEDGLQVLCHCSAPSRRDP
jgi:hypothetical protein